MDKTFKYYQSYLEENYCRFIESLIPCFIEYYGTQYGDTIVSNILSTNTIFYSGRKKRMEKPDEPSERYSELKKEYKQINKYIHKNSIYEPYETRVSNKIIYSSRDYNCFDLDFLKTLNDTFINGYTCFIPRITSFGTTTYLYRFAAIPLFFASDIALIHELIHSTTTSLIIKENGCRDSKTGLIISNDQYDQYLEEQITQIDAENIHNLYTQNNTPFITPFYYKKKTESSYNILGRLVEPFYREYRKEIIDARITQDKHPLLTLLEEKKYRKYANIVQSCFNNCAYEEDEDYYVYYLISKSILETMNSNRLQLARTL